MSGPFPRQDAVFLDPQAALACARLRQRVPVWGRVDGCQLCYYLAEEALPEQLDNLVHLHPATMLEQLVATRLRLPSLIHLPPDLPRDVRANYTRILSATLKEAAGQRQQRIEDISAAIAAMPPRTPATGRPLRVYAAADRNTAVTQYSCRGLIEAFTALGHQAELLIEANDRERTFITWHRLQRVVDTAPDIVIHINEHTPWACPPGAIQVTWWQDPMPALVKPTPLPWRREDLAYVVEGYFRPGVIATGLAPERVRTQHFCVDDTVFHPPAAERPRRRAVVFVGTSYRRFVDPGKPAEGELIRRIDAIVDAGKPLAKEEVIALAGACGVDPNHAVCRTMVYCTRDRFVRQLCSQSGIPVEIYGMGWESDPVVAPFFRGPVQHGPALADLYRDVSHALCTHPFLINHQRLAEIGSCGCIPVCWDARGTAEPPYWDEETLYFRDAASLNDAIARSLPTHPERFRAHFSYQRFAKRIIDDASSEGLLP